MVCESCKRTFKKVGGLFGVDVMGQKIEILSEKDIQENDLGNFCGKCLLQMITEEMTRGPM